MWQVFIKEINSLLNSLTAYLVIAVFLTSIGLLTWVFPESSVLEYGYADLNTLFSLGPYVFMFLIPAVTMRCLSEERKTGTLELLLTRPLTDWQIILGKYLASFVVVIFAILPTLVYFYSIYQLGSPKGNIDAAGTIGSYVGLIMLGGVFTAIGVFTSSLTENQVVAFVVAVFLSFLLFSGFTSVANMGLFGATDLFIEKIGLSYHYSSLSRGLIDSRDMAYFIGITTLMLTFTYGVLDSRKW